MSTSLLRPVAPGVYAAEAPQKFYGLEVGARMTVLELAGGLLVHSPLALDPGSVAHLGEPRWVVAPNLFHHLHAGPWIEAGVEAWAAPGLPAKRPDLAFAGTLAPGRQPFGGEVAVLPLTCLPLTNEVAVLHRPSRTLVVTDLLFNFSTAMPWATRTAMRGLCGYPGCRATLVERLAMRRREGRAQLAELAQWDFDRLIMSHGQIVETGGKEAFLSAFRWLLRSP